MIMETTWPPNVLLRGPGASVPVNLVIAVITSRYTSNSINERAGRLLAENQHYNVWYQLNKARCTEDRDRELAAASSQLLQRSWTAWSQYVAIWEAGGRPEADDYRSLVAVFDEVARAYRGLCR